MAHFIFSNPAATMLVRQKRVIKFLTEANAFSAETAVKLEDTKINAPHMFENVNKMMIKKGLMKQTENGRLYLIKKEQ